MVLVRGRCRSDPSAGRGGASIQVTTATLMAGHFKTGADRVAQRLSLVELQQLAWDRNQPD